MKLVYVPLDERPCNVLFPSMQLPKDGGITLAMPPRELLGYKKRPADTAMVADWLEREIAGADALIMPVEMVLYGGLIPSRVHNLTQKTLDGRLLRLHDLLRTAKGYGCRIYLYGMIMRTPAYSSAEEEPDYYETYGKALFTRGYLSHKLEVAGLTEEEHETLLTEVAQLPDSVIDDYDTRRRLNHSALRRVVDFVSEGLLDRLILPEDDTATYGYGPRENTILRSLIRSSPVGDRIFSYPGADEVGTVLVAAATLAATETRVAVAPIYLDPAARQLIPRYESRPLGESVRSQIAAMGATLVEDPGAADLILAMNSCPQEMGEAWNQKPADACALRQAAFVDSLRVVADQHGLQIAMADCASANGGTSALVYAIEKAGLWDYFCAYAGWNTTGNTIGTALAQGALHCIFRDEEVRRENLVYRLLDDWAYQTVVRQELGRQPNGFNAVALGDRSDAARQIARDELNALWARTFSGVGLPATAGLESVEFPWDRLFEVELHVNSTANLRR